MVNYPIETSYCGHLYSKKKKIVYFKLIFYIQYYIMESLYNINLDIDKENYGLVNDIVRIVTIQLITQLLFFLNNNNVSFFNTTFLKTVVFLCIGVF